MENKLGFRGRSEVDGVLKNRVKALFSRTFFDVSQLESVELNISSQNIYIVQRGKSF